LKPCEASFSSDNIVLSQLSILNLQSLNQGLPAVTPAFGMAIDVEVDARGLRQQIDQKMVLFT
jgi:sulfur transfer complex TusBCD TusB component (DsrH family)